MASYDAINRRLAALAARQFGLVTREQARMAGLSSGQINGRLSSGRWVRADRGVYALAGVPTTWHQRAWAAVHAAPQGAHASHLTAAALAGLAVAPPTQPHLTVGRGRSTRLAGAVVHTARLTPTDITAFQGVPATTVPRTLVDCAGLLGPIRLQRLVDDALHRRLVRPNQIPAIWDKARLRPGRAGERRLRAALEPWHGPILPDRRSNDRAGACCGSTSSTSVPASPTCAPHSPEPGARPPQPERSAGPGRGGARPNTGTRWLHVCPAFRA